MSAVRKQLYYFWKKLSEQQSRKKFATRFFKKDIERFHSCPTKKATAQIKQEMKALHQYWGCFPFQYYQFDLYRADCTLSLEEMKTYVPKFFLNYLFFPISYKDYGVLCEDKLLTYALLKAYDVPQPKLLFCYDHNTFYDGANNRISTEEVDKIIVASNATKLFAKTRFGSEGKGIFIFSKNASLQFTDEKQTVFSHRFFTGDARSAAVEGRDSSGFYLVQEGLVQHESMNRIYPHSVNTVRMITGCVNGKAELLYALLRMGCGGQQVDNAAMGGLYIKVDKETGQLAGKAFTSDHTTHAIHPDTGFRFEGAQIERWNEMKVFSISVAEKFREIEHLGWDIALTTDGFSVIEVNHHTGFDIVQDCHGGARDVLHINPKDWWYQSAYTIKNL